MPGKRKKTGQGVRSFHRIGRPIKHKKSSNYVDKTLLPESLESVEDSLELIQQRVTVNELPDGWYMNYVADKELQYFQVVRQQLNTPMVVLRLFLINRDLRYQMYVAGHLVSPQSSILSKLPSIVTVDGVIHMINAFHDANICLGNFDDPFINLAHKKKGKFLSCNGQLTAYLDESFCLEVNGMTHASTIRHANCEILLVDNEVCCHCAKFRNTLRALTWKLKSVSGVLSLHTNIRFLRTPQRTARFVAVRKAIMNKNKQLQRLRVKLSSAVETDGILVDDELSSDLQQVVNNKSDHESVFEDDEFKRAFWDQQVAACKAKKNGIRWHPLFIRWCLNIMLTSSKTYDIIRESGFISLPSKRTLRDYTHWTKLKAGFSAELLNHLRKEAKVDSLAEWQRYVVLALDEMKIREDLIFDKFSGEITGFVDFGDEGLDQKFAVLQQQCKGQSIFEREVATHMLTLMVRGLMFHLNFPIAQFATTGVSAEYLMHIVWRAIRMLEMCGLTVISVVADGCSTNRKFFRLHRIPDYQKSGVTYLAPNISSPGNQVYFMADAPHVLKTVRNAWYNSRTNGTRNLVNNRGEIKWAHLIELAEKATSNTGLYINKLTREHLILTSYSRMNVRLAAQVLSTSVANGFETLRGLNMVNQDSTETEHFCRMFDKFFDLFNTRSVTEAQRKKKPNLSPYYNRDDPRLDWLERTFLSYLNDWDEWVQGNEKIPKGAKKCCTLPDQTIEGLKICVHSLTGVVRFLLSYDDIQFVLSERFNQDPVEVFFGQQRSRGQRNDNPSVAQFLYNTQALIVQKSLAIGGSSNISRKRDNPLELSPLSRPLPKRKRRKLVEQI